MPTYDYRCERTGQMFELWQSFTDDAIETCPQTHDGESDVCGAPVKKVFSKVGISFKGEGFYKTDHGSSAPKKPSSDSAGSAPETASTNGSSGGTSDSGSSGSSDSGSSASSSTSD